MEALVRVRGVAAPLMRINIDTDQLSPGSSNFKGDRTDMGLTLFGNWRYREDGSENPDFILNREPWRRATILLADRNFGAGSSRKSGPAALRGFGFRVVIAPSFGGVFYDNAIRWGVLPVALPLDQVRRLVEQIEGSAGAGAVTVDLESEEVTAPGGERFAFRTPPVLRRMLLGGLDEIAFTLSMSAEIEDFWRRDRAARPWMHGLRPELPSD